MMETPHIITLVASVIAALSGIYAVLLSGSRNVAACRVKWIEDVRLALSEYVSLTLTKKNDKDASDATKRMAERELYIRLALNPEEHKNLYSLLTLISLEHMTKVESDLEIPVNQLMDEAQIVFRNEWKKAKREMRWAPW